MSGFVTVANQRKSPRSHWRNLMSSADNVRCRAAQSLGEVGRACEFFVNSPRVNLTANSFFRDNFMHMCTRADTCCLMGPKRYSEKPNLGGDIPPVAAHHTINMSGGSSNWITFFSNNAKGTRVKRRGLKAKGHLYNDSAEFGENVFKVRRNAMGASFKT